MEHGASCLPLGIFPFIERRRCRMADDELRIDEHPRRWRVSQGKAIYNSENSVEVSLPVIHPLNQVIDALLSHLLPFFDPEALPEERLRGEELCGLLQAEIEHLPTEQKYEAIVATLTAHWHDPEWIRVISTFCAVEDERYTIKEYQKGSFIADWSGNHVDGKCQVKQARKPFRPTNAQLAAVRPTALHSTLPRGVIRLASRKASEPSLRDFGTTNPRIPAIKKQTS